MIPIEKTLPTLMYRTLDAVMPAYRELFARFELTEQQWRVLRVIWKDQDVTSAQLSERSLLSPPSLVAIIDRLEKKELVTRIRSKDDRRRIYVVATTKGRQLQMDITPQVTAIHDRIQASLSSAEWIVLEELLGRVSSSALANQDDKLKSAG